MATILQRPLRGSRISSFYPVKTLPSLSSLESAFQLQEYISLLIRLDVHDVDAIVSVPGTATGNEKFTSNDGIEEEGKRDLDSDMDTERKTDIAVDEACWIYEQLRRLAQDLSHPLITMLQQECTRSSCPEMKAGEWLYLCVAHGNEGAMEQCCAIDYILHTLDSATALLNSPRAFPSRLQIPQTSHRHFSSLARRLGRIFAHAYFHHREAFEQAEAESSLYARFLALTSKFDLVPAEFLVIPPRPTPSDGNEREDANVQLPRLMAAAVHPQGYQDGYHGSTSRDGEGGTDVSPYKEHIVLDQRPKSRSPPGLGSDSPRKFGRSRTDTMVFSEGHNIAEELAKAQDDAIEGTSEKVETAFGPPIQENSGAVPSQYPYNSSSTQQEGQTVTAEEPSPSVELPSTAGVPGVSTTLYSKTSEQTSTSIPPHDTILGPIVPLTELGLNSTVYPIQEVKADEEIPEGASDEGFNLPPSSNSPSSSLNESLDSERKLQSEPDALQLSKSTDPPSTPHPLQFDNALVEHVSSESNIPVTEDMSDLVVSPPLPEEASSSYAADLSTKPDIVADAMPPPSDDESSLPAPTEAFELQESQPVEAAKLDVAMTELKDLPPTDGTVDEV